MTGHLYNNNLLVTYDSLTKCFSFGNEVNNFFLSSNPFSYDNVCNKSLGNDFFERLESIAASNKAEVLFFDKSIKILESTEKWFRIGLIKEAGMSKVLISLTEITDEITYNNHLLKMLEVDELTGLYTKSGFSKAVEAIISDNPQKKNSGNYAFVYFDIIKFKAINDIFGKTGGDLLLIHIGEKINSLTKNIGCGCRLGSDRFVFFADISNKNIDDYVNLFISEITDYDLPFRVNCNVGVYITSQEMISVSTMIDRAILAQSNIKGLITQKYNLYTEEMRKQMLTEQEITGSMNEALEKNEFEAFFQPQYDHVSGNLVGAEALARWRHPEKGLISPGLFIPIFEKNGFITTLDMYIFEFACKFIRDCMDKGIRIVPISTNFSRYDIFQPDFIDQLEKNRKKYSVPVDKLRIEITESAVSGGSEYTNNIVKKLHDVGYIVEMDDFGSGYSSLNVLKDIDFDIIKLDMKFLSDNSQSNRGGTIISSVVRMAKWLGLPIIAEGVEKVKQADMLGSIGCNYIQGYLYSKPLVKSEFENLLVNSNAGEMVSQLRLIDNINPNNFWDLNSQETLIFNNYVGAAALVEYTNNRLEIIRVNKKYVHEVGMNLSEEEILTVDVLSTFDETNKRIFLDNLKKAEESLEEQEFETWTLVKSSYCGEEKICLRTNLRMLGKSNTATLYYMMIRNVTSEKERFMEAKEYESRFKRVIEQENIYYWEYNVSNKEMRPCFRCMRDLGLPSVVRNYPEPSIEKGIIPEDYAQMFRDWHKQIENGVEKLEAIIPLTADRIPFRVKYTTEFDSSGKPVKAFGSALLVSD